MKTCREMHCPRQPSKCPHAIDKDEGDSWYSGLPTRLYWAGPDCPELKDDIPSIPIVMVDDGLLHEIPDIQISPLDVAKLKEEAKDA